MNLARVLPIATIAAAALAAPAAATAPPAATAVVDADGNLARGFAVVSASRQDTGVYTVTFTDNKTSTDCAYVASVGLSGNEGISLPGWVDVLGVSAGTIAVRTYDTRGNAADRGFHVYVTC